MGSVPDAVGPSADERRAGVQQIQNFALFLQNICAPKPIASAALVYAKNNSVFAEGIASAVSSAIEYQQLLSRYRSTRRKAPYGGTAIGDRVSLLHAAMQSVEWRLAEVFADRHTFSSAAAGSRTDNKAAEAAADAPILQIYDIRRRSACLFPSPGLDQTHPPTPGLRPGAAVRPTTCFGPLELK